MTKPVRIGLAVNHSYTFYRSVLRGIARYAEFQPHWLFASLVPEQESLHALGRFKPAGLIATVATQEMVQALSHWRRPVVNAAVILPGLNLPTVRVDNGPVGRLAADHFLERGLRHFAYVGPPNMQYSIERLAAFRERIQKAGFCVACYQTPATFDPLGRRWDLDRGIYRWLRKLPKPVGLFTPGDNWAVQVSEACRQAGLRVPEDVALLGVDDDDLDCEFTRPRLSSIVLPAERIGYEAAALLDRLLSGEKPPAQPILLPPTGIATRRSTEVLAFDDADVVAAVRFIRENAHLPISVTDVARKVALGRRTLERRCRQTLGWGLGEEIRRAHLELARRLLARTDLSMERVAIQSGFSGLRHMGQVFRQELGMAPTSYRRKMRSGG